MGKKVDLVGVKYDKPKEHDCDCIYCLRNQGTIRALEWLNAYQEKRIEALLEELRMNGPAAEECKVIPWH
jgi:hypothetical protein